MRFQLFLASLSSLLLVSLAHRTSEDYINIQREISEFNILFDLKQFSKIGPLFTPNATYNAGDGDVQGIPAIEGVLAKIGKPGTITQLAATTQDIELLEPSKGSGAADTAKAITYITATFLGSGKLKGEAFFVFAQFSDTFIQTGDLSLFGGWKFTSRKFIELVSCCVGCRETWLPSLAVWAHC